MASPKYHSLLIIFIPILYSSVLGLDSFDWPQFPTSAISAAPAFLPESPLSSPPAMSPDISPLFPSGSGPSPSESEMPTIPSSPSPPNPDVITTPAVESAFPPLGPVMESSGRWVGGSGFVGSSIVAALFVLFW